MSNRPFDAVILELSCTPDLASFLRREGIRGRTGETCSCPIAQYLRRETGKPWIEVTSNHISAGGEGHQFTYSEDTPGNVQRFIDEFDNGDYPDLEYST